MASHHDGTELTNQQGHHRKNTGFKEDRQADGYTEF